jgi:hypothetical protein
MTDCHLKKITSEICDYGTSRWLWRVILQIFFKNQLPKSMNKITIKIKSICVLIGLKDWPTSLDVGMVKQFFARISYETNLYFFIRLIKIQISHFGILNIFSACLCFLLRLMHNFMVLDALWPFLYNHIVFSNGATRDEQGIKIGKKILNVSSKDYITYIVWVEVENLQWQHAYKLILWVTVMLLGYIYIFICHDPDFRWSKFFLRFSKLGTPVWEQANFKISDTGKISKNCDHKSCM